MNISPMIRTPVFLLTKISCGLLVVWCVLAVCCVSVQNGGLTGRDIDPGLTG